MIKLSPSVKKIFVVATMAVIAANASACIGKGKGKAPPPIDAPIIRKG